MIRGAQRRMIVLKDTKSGVFEEAYFILKSGVDVTGTLCFDDMVSEANRIVGNAVPKEHTEKRDMSGVICFLTGLISGIALCLLCCFLF